MPPKHYTAPLGSKLPALERHLLKLRALEMVLVIFYAEELKRKVIGMVQCTDAWLERPERVLSKTPKKVEKALSALVADGAITTAEKSEIVELIDYRNSIAHDIHDLFADLSQESFAREAVVTLPDKFKRYDYNAVERLQVLYKKLDASDNLYMTEFTLNRVFFGVAERVFLAEIKNLRHKIVRLAKIRKTKIVDLNKQFSLDGSELVGEFDPRHPLNRYEDGRLTLRGAEVCYRLFDLGKTPLAVAHMMGLRLSSITARHRKWKTLGGINRAKLDLTTLPRRKFYRREDD